MDIMSIMVTIHEIIEIYENNSGDSADMFPYGRAMHCMDLSFESESKDGYTELTGDPEKMFDDVISKWKPYNEDTKYNMVITMKRKWDC